MRAFPAIGFLAVAVACVAAPAEDEAPGALRDAPRPLDPRECRVGELVPDVAFTDVAGRAGRLSQFRGGALVVAFTNSGCPVAKRYAPRLAAIEREFSAKGVAFLYADPTPTDTAAAMRKLAAERGWTAPLVLDGNGELAAALGARSTTDVFVLDGARTLVYRGPVDDQYGIGYQTAAPRRTYLRSAIEAVLAGGRPSETALSAPGCLLGRDAEPPARPAPTWNGRVARIFQRSCEECHREGENGPFPLVTLEDARANAETIRLMVGRGAMPPWFAEGRPGQFANDSRLSAAEKTDVLAWIRAGCPAGDPSEAPLPVVREKGWKIGKPDLVVEASRAVAVAAEGTMEYQHVVAYPGVAESKWIEAMEVRPTAPEVVHHVLVFLRYPRSDPRWTPPDPVAGLSGFFAAMVPGQGVMTFPEGTGRELPKGATLVFQIHYQPNGTATSDRPRIAFRFAKEPPSHEVATLGVHNTRFRIPPGAENHEVTASRTFEEDGRILAYMPHTHLRGRAFRFERVRLDGTRELLADVPRYDFNWQIALRLREPVEVRKGEKLVATAWYDNSAKNPANPDPTRTVRFGDQTTDEMMIGYFDFVPAAPRVPK